VCVCVKQSETENAHACERARVSAFNRRQSLFTVKGVVWRVGVVRGDDGAAGNFGW